MNHFMDLLYARLKPLVEARWFEVVMNLIILANPAAVFPQLLVAFTAPNIAGISAPMWYAFACIQAAFIFCGIKTKNATMFFSMLTTFLESIAIIAAVHIRG